MFTPLTGRRVLVTGGTRGIGKGIATAFVSAGESPLALDELVAGQ